MTTGPQWGQSFSYDGFGNMLAQTVTKGQAPTLSVNVDPATNRITTGGYSYDSNGNLTAMPLLAMSYNVDNRLAQAVSSLNGTDQFVYDPQGQRVAKNENGSWNVYFYGVDGNLLSTSWNDYNIYFGRKLIYSESYPAGPVVEDRLASTVKHFPYGEEPNTTNQNRTKFATYYRDATTALDYAQQRYYARTIGRFTSPDPYIASGGPSNPQSWNRYAYVENDPVNFNDPSGLMRSRAGSIPSDPLMDEFIQMLRFAGGGYTGPRLEWRPEDGGEVSPTWDELSESCQKGLEAAMTGTGRAATESRLAALARATAEKDTLMAAADEYSIDWHMLAAIGIRESGFKSVSEVDGAGVGVGVFQITVGKRTGVTAKDAGNLAWAADRAAATLSHNAAFISKRVPDLSDDMLTWSMLASWNTGATGQVRRLRTGRSPDWHTAPIGPPGPKRMYRNDYGTNVLDLMDCF